MSASHKKQLRKEQNAAQLTEKQLAEQKEAKSLRRYTAAFVAVLVLVVAIVIFTTVTSSGIIERGTTALTVDNAKISAVELNYYYIDAINQFISQLGDYISLSGLDTSKALDEQVYNQETGDTWADYFLDQATTNAHSVYAMYNKAIAEGNTLSDEDKMSIDSTLSTMQLYAYSYGYSDLQTYLVAMYGDGANEKSFRDYFEVQYVASAYAVAKDESLTYGQADFEAVLAEDPKAYTSYTYNYYYIPTTSFLTGGTTSDDGAVTYSDEEKAAAEKAAKAAAEELAAGTYADAKLFDKAIGQMEMNKDKENVASTAANGKLYSQISTLLADWVTDDARKFGDVGCIPSEVTTTGEDGTETTTVNGYYVIFFGQSNDNTFFMDNVRHILVSFEGGTKGEDGTTTYSDEEKAAAKAEAEELLNTYLAGEQTEDAFAALATQKTDDTASASTGGLISSILPTSNYVENFLNWSIDPARTQGETGIVETEYGYHVMYFVGESELTYRDTMIESDLRSEAMNAWQTELRDAATLTVKNTGRVNTHITLGGDN